MDAASIAAWGTVAVTVVGALGTQIRSTMKLSRSIGSPNGLGSIHEAIAKMDGRLSGLCVRLEAVEEKVGQ